MEYKAKRIKFVCVAMGPLVTSLCSCDLLMISLNITDSSRLTVTQRLVLDGKTSTCFHAYFDLLPLATRIL